MLNSKKNKNLIFITGNLYKLEEVKLLLPNFVIKNKNLDINEIQGNSEEIVENKAFSAHKILKKPLFVEDTSLYFESLNNLPGPYIKEFIKNLSLNQIYKIANLNCKGLARAVCLVGFIDEDEKFHLFKGECFGKIVYPKKNNGFDWDRIFKPNDHKITFSQMSKFEKNKISHRKLAFEKFNKYLMSKNN